jgi:hypothetical protein
VLAIVISFIKDYSPPSSPPSRPYNDGDQIIADDAELKKHITFYYKGLFGPPSTPHVMLDSSWTHDIPQVSDEDNSYLTLVFTEEEIRNAIF